VRRIWRSFRRAWHNPIFRGGLRTFAQQPTHRSYSLNYVATLSVVLLITWPKEGFLNLRDLPFTYNALGGTTLIILAYLNVSQGAHRFLGARYLSLHDWLLLAPVKAGTFLRGYLAASCLELLLFWGLSLPLLVLAARVSGESLAHLGTGILLILVCVGSYRVVGVALLTLFERDEFLLYILVRLLYVFFILGSGFVVPLYNPVLAFADASIWPHRLGTLALPGLTVRGWAATLVLHLLLAGGFFIIALIRVHWVQRRGAAPEVREEGLGHG
jgi:hypothetical protein